MRAAVRAPGAARVMCRACAAALLCFVFAAHGLPGAGLRAQEKPPPAAPPAQPDGGTLNLLDVARNTSAMMGRLYLYTYMMKKTLRELDKQGRVKEERVTLSEGYPSRGRRLFVNVLVSENGVALSPERLAKERERAGRELQKDAEREEKKSREAQVRDPAAAAAPTHAPLNYVGFIATNSSLFAERSVELSVMDFLIFSDFQSCRRVSRLGRAMVACDFLPHAAVRPEKSSRSAVTRLAGRAWVDLSDLVVARLEAWPVGADEQFKPVPSPATSADAPVIFEQSRLPDGTWVSGLMRINTFGREKVFGGVVTDMTLEYGEYKLFSAEAGDATLETPGGKP